MNNNEIYNFYIESRKPIYEEYTKFMEKNRYLNSKYYNDIYFMFITSYETFKSENWSNISNNMFRKVINPIDLIFTNYFFNDVEKLFNIEFYKNLENVCPLNSVQYKAFANMAEVTKIIKFWKNEAYMDLHENYNLITTNYVYNLLTKTNFKIDSVSVMDTVIDEEEIPFNDEDACKSYRNIKANFTNDINNEKFIKNDIKDNIFEQKFIFNQHKILRHLIEKIKLSVKYLSMMLMETNEFINKEFIDMMCKCFNSNNNSLLNSINKYINAEEVDIIEKIIKSNMIAIYVVYLVCVLPNLKEFIEIEAYTVNKNDVDGNKLKYSSRQYSAVFAHMIAEIYRNKSIFGMFDVVILDLVCSFIINQDTSLGLNHVSFLFASPTIDYTYINDIGASKNIVGIDDKYNYNLSFLSNINSYIYEYSVRGNCALYAFALSLYNKKLLEEFEDVLPIVSCEYLSPINIKPPNVYYNNFICDMSFTRIFTQIKLFSFNLVFFGEALYQGVYGKFSEERLYVDTKQKYNSIKKLEYLKKSNKKVINMACNVKKVMKNIGYYDTPFKFFDDASVLQLNVNKKYKNYKIQDINESATSLHALTFISDDYIFKQSKIARYVDINFYKCVFQEHKIYIIDKNIDLLFDAISSMLKYNGVLLNPNVNGIIPVSFSDKFNINGIELFDGYNGIKDKSLVYWWGFILNGKDIVASVNLEKGGLMNVVDLYVDDFRNIYKLDIAFNNDTKYYFQVMHVNTEYCKYRLIDDIRKIKKIDLDETFVLKSDYYPKSYKSVLFKKDVVELKSNDAFDKFDKAIYKDMIYKNDSVMLLNKYNYTFIPFYLNFYQFLVSEYEGGGEVYLNMKYSEFKKDVDNIISKYKSIKIDYDNIKDLHIKLFKDEEIYNDNNDNGNGDEDNRGYIEYNDDLKINDNYERYNDNIVIKQYPKAKRLLIIFLIFVFLLVCVLICVIVYVFYYKGKKNGVN